MNEEQAKHILKWILDNGYRNLNDTEKELIKQTIDHSANIDELAIALLAAISANNAERK